MHDITHYLPLLSLATRIGVYIVVPAWFIYAAWQGQAFKRRQADAELRREVRRMKP